MIQIGALISGLAELFSKFFAWRTAKSDNQALEEVIDDKRDLEKACRFAENAICIAEKEAFFKNKKTYKRFNHFVRKFRRYK